MYTWKPEKNTDVPFHHSLPYLLETSSLTEPGVKLAASPLAPTMLGFQAMSESFTWVLRI